MVHRDDPGLVSITFKLASCAGSFSRFLFWPELGFPDPDPDPEWSGLRAVPVNSWASWTTF
jgi:hypothetical protein